MKSLKCMCIITLKLFTLLPIKNKTNNNKHVICQLNMQLQKKWNLIQDSPAVKKSVQPPRMLLWKKMWNPKWRPRNGCGGSLKVKILITTIQVNLSRIVVKCGEGNTKFIWFVIIKIFAFSLPPRPFLGHHFGFHIFFHNSILGDCTLFLQLGCFD